MSLAISKQISGEGGELLVKGLGKEIAGELIAKGFAKNLSGEGGEAIAKGLGKNISKEISESTSKSLTGKFTNWAAKNKGSLAVGAAALAVGTGLAIKSDQDNKTKEALILQISSITDVTDGVFSNVYKAKIHFTPNVKITKKDIVILDGTNSTPELKGRFNTAEVISENEIIINTTQKITTPGTTGTMKIDTSFSNQYAQNTGGLVKDVGGVVGAGVGAGVDVTVNEVVKPAVKEGANLFNEFLTGVFGSGTNFLIAVVATLFLLVIVYVAAKRIIG